MKHITKLINGFKKIIFCMFITLTINAEDFKDGTEIKATANINFRDEVKDSFWSDPKILKVVQPGDKLMVIKTKKINLPFFKSRVWLNVQDFDTGEIGWVYNGKVGEIGYFSAKKLENEGELQ